ncbi:MAG: poly(R)-hydroxyalkanoic acid synthase subunit PhaE [Steroidobacteraceae bacterium]
MSGDSMPDPGTEDQDALLRQVAEGGTEAIRRIRQFGNDYLGITQELWRFVESRVSGMAGAPVPDAAGGRDQLRGALQEKFAQLYLPVLAPLRGQQQTGERLMATTLRWQRATSRMSELFAAVAADTVERLIAALSGPQASGPPVTSLRQLHDLWVECGERAYAAVAHGDEYAAAQAELLMAMVEMRFEQRRAIEEWARAFNLPTRTEIDAIHRRLHELGRSIREAQKR